MLKGLKKELKNTPKEVLKKELEEIAEKYKDGVLATDLIKSFKQDIMLKGKLKEEFESFYNKITDKDLTHPRLEVFYNMHFNLQKGVYEAFFKSKDYRIEIVFGIDLKTSEFDGYDWSILKIQKDLTVKELYGGWNEFEVEAFEEAINKLNEILN